MEITVKSLREISRQSLLNKVGVKENYEDLLQTLHHQAELGATSYLIYKTEYETIVWYSILRLLKLDGFEVTTFPDKSSIEDIVDIGW